MDAHSVSIRCGPKYASGLLALLTVCVHMAASADSAPAHRFALSGSGTVKLDLPAQKSATLSLRAYLVPTGAALAASPPVQDGGTFVVMAKLLAKAAVCYNDTIFRDDYDGDGG
jgi:hypothetical protein